MKISFITLVVLLLGAVVAAVMADEEYAAPAYEKNYDGYFQYANVPSNNEYEFGYNRGNPSHYTSRYEQSKDHRFRTKVMRADTYDGYGEQNWRYFFLLDYFFSAKAAPSYEKKYDVYFQNATVPGNDEYELGYNRGNPSH